MMLDRARGPLSKCASLTGVSLDCSASAPVKHLQTSSVYTSAKESDKLLEYPRITEAATSEDIPTSPMGEASKTRGVQEHFPCEKTVRSALKSNFSSNPRFAIVTMIAGTQNKSVAACSRMNSISLAGT